MAIILTLDPKGPSNSRSSSSNSRSFLAKLKAKFYEVFDLEGIGINNFLGSK